MANEYIDPSGLNYAIPQSFVGNRAQPVQAAQPDVSMLLPKADEELAHVNGLTDAYYNQYGTLKRFAEEMARKGIDVTKPQYGEPGGGELFKTYLGLEADLRSTSNMLKREKEQRAMLSQQIATGQGNYVQGFDPTSQVGVEQNLQEIFVPNKLLPEVTQMMERAQTVTNTKGDYDKFVADQGMFIEELEAARDSETNPARKQYLQNNIDSLISVRPHTIAYGALVGKGGAKDPSTALNITKPILALRRGALDPEQVQYQVRGGEAVAFTPQLSGEPYGKVSVPKKDNRGNIIEGEFKTVDRRIKGVEVRPNNTVWFVFEADDEGNPVDPERIDNQSAQLILTNIIQSKGGSTASNKVIESLISLGALDEFGIDVNESHPSLFGEQGNTALAGVSNKLQQDLAQKQANISAAKEYVGKLLEGVSGDHGLLGISKSKVVPIKAKKGDKEYTLKFTRGGSSGKLYVEEGAPVLGLENNKQYTDQEILEAFEKKGFLNYYLNNPVIGTTNDNPFLK